MENATVLAGLVFVNLGVSIVNARRLSKANRALNVAERAHAKAEKVEAEIAEVVSGD